MDVNDARGITQSTTKAGTSAGTTTTLTTANIVQYSINGKAYSKAATANQATPTTDAVTGAAFLPLTVSKGCAFVWGYNAAGALLAVQGSVEELDTAADGANAVFKKSPQFPASMPADFAPFAYQITRVGASGATWTLGSSNLAGPPSNVHHAYVDIHQLPVRPQVS